MIMNLEFIKNRITSLIMKKNISERQLSQFIGKSDNYINKITTGRSVPKMSSFFDICEYFEITPFEFFYPAIENPIVTKKIYDEIVRLSDNNVEEFLFILENTTVKEYRSFISFIFRLKQKEFHKSS